MAKTNKKDTNDTNNDNDLTKNKTNDTNNVGLYVDLTQDRYDKLKIYSIKYKIKIRHWLEKIIDELPEV
jgi:hypothetical protein